MKHLVTLLLTLLSFSFGQRLKSYNIDPKSLTVSGVSSGAAFALQYHVAHSSSVFGAGIIAGPPYWCAQDSVTLALTSCTSTPSLINLSVLYAATQYAYSIASIDNPSFLSNSRVWLFSGTEDTTVYSGVVEKTFQYYKNYISDPHKTYFMKNFPANHAWITNSYGNSCNFLGTPFINNCNYDAPGQMLQFLYNQTLSKPSPKTQSFSKFSQQFYTPGGIEPATFSLASTGYIYVPETCQLGAKCKLHIAFHGCAMGPDSIGDAFVKNSGLNQWAETNDIIVVYPQVVMSSVLPYNPKGCWDWWGYTGPQYATKIGPQIYFVSNVVSTLLGQTQEDSS